MDTAPPPAKGKKLFNSGSVSKPDEDYDAEPSAADRGACDPIISAAPRAQFSRSHRAMLSSSQVCQTVCVTEHQSVHQIFDEMNNWVRALRRNSAECCAIL